MFITLLLLLPLVAAVALYAAARTSRDAARPAGLVDGRLRPCPETPNCVASTPGGALPGREVAALSSDGEEPDVAWRRLRAAVVASGGVIRVEHPDYLAATYSTRWFGFVDDLEAHRDTSAGVIHLRSASRVGRSDLGANRARIARLADLYQRAGS